MRGLQPAPKPQKPERGTAECARHMSAVSRLPCICCGRPCEVLHHAIHGRHAQRRASDKDVLPMCVEHHAMLHDRPAEWQALYGRDADYLRGVKVAAERLRATTIGGR